jgi:hypothetical protein
MLARDRKPVADREHHDLDARLLCLEGGAERKSRPLVNSRHQEHEETRLDQPNI